jgi:hypothetical protein
VLVMECEFVQVGAVFNLGSKPVSRSSIKFHRPSLVACVKAAGRQTNATGNFCGRPNQRLGVSLLIQVQSHQ